MKTNILGNMKQYTKVICTVAMMLCVGEIMEAAVTKTYVFTTKSWNAISDGQANWTSGQDGIAFENAGIKATTSNNNAYGTSPMEFANISEIVVIYNTNKNGGAGNIKLQIGSNDEVSHSVGYTSCDDGRVEYFEETFNYSPTQSGSVKMTINTTTNSLYVVAIMITYAPSAYTVTYDPGAGTCSSTSDTETGGGEGVELPAATPNATGWEFAGWAEESCDETTTAPRLYLEGDYYYPDKATTLYAVYRKMTDGTTTSTATFTASTESGLTVINKSPYTNKGWLHTASGIEFYIEDYGIYSSTFNLDNRTSHGYALLSANRRIKSVVFTASNASYLIDEVVAYDDGDVDFSTSSTTQTATGSGNVTQLLLSTAAGTSSESRITEFVVTYYDTKFNSNPCGNIVALSDGTKTNVSSIAFSSDNIETCSSTAANRQVTVTVTTNTGYKMVDALGFAKTGTVTATKNSGPTGSGPYTYVYEFNQNDNGTGTFSATATAKTYTITLDSEGGSDGSANVVLTYASSSHDAITNPTKTGYTFAGWYSGDDGTGELVINTNGELQNSVTVSTVPWTDASGNWKKDGAVTLHAKWNINKYKVTLASPTTVTISATTPSIAEGAYAEVNYNSTVTLTYSSLVEGRQWFGWKVTKDADGSNVTASVVSTNTLTVPAYDVTVNAEVYGGFAFSCAELTLTPVLVTAGTPIFITSAASKMVRSQDSILIVGNGLTPSTTLTFPGLPSKFAIKSRTGGTLQTDGSGEINAVAYIFYTPDAEDTSDGLDKLTGITVSVGGAKPKTATLTQDIIGRHLPADFVIAAKKDGKWWAMPSNMSSTTNPKPSEIAVNDYDNPSVAYTATSNIYGLEGPTTSGSGNNISTGNGQYIRLTMSIDDGSLDPHAAPLFGSATGTRTIGKSGNSQASSHLSEGWWWALTQTNTSISNPQDAKYTIKCANNTSTLSLRDNAGDPDWGLFASGVEQLRLIPSSASSVVPTEAEIVAWGKNEAIIEVDQPTIGATSVIGKLPGDIESEKITLSQTCTSKGTGTRYNYTVDFGEGVDFSANEGKMLTLEWYNVLDNLVAVSNVTVPRIVASNTTINSTNYPTKSVWNTEVHVLPGDTLTIDASGYSTKNKDVTIKELHIYPGAAVIINTDTLKVTNLVLRSGWSRIGETFYGMGSLYIKPESGNGSMKATNAYLDWYIDYDQYYPIAVPWKVATASISYQNMTVATSAGLFVRYYDGERHAKGGKDGDGNTNWKQYSWDTDMPTHLEPGIGYAVTARRPAGKAFSIIRMPLTIPSADWTKDGEQGEVSSVHKDQVAVTAWVKDEGETPDHAKGWNCIANPYMCMYEGEITHSVDDDYNIAYVNIPDVNFKEFDQVEISDAKLKPGSAFLIQTEETGTLTFGTSNRKASAPSYRTATPKATKQKAYIILSGEEAEDKMGLIISERYTAEYEINADLEKLLSDGNTLRTFMRYGELNMAYVAINEDLAKEWIPVTVRIPEAGEYTFSLHEASKISELEGVYLIDYETNTVTNLIESNYSFVAAEGTIDDRFAINAIVGSHETPTDIDIINAGGDINSDKPFKLIFNDKVFILHNGVIYDSSGKKVREINR